MLNPGMFVCLVFFGGGAGFLELKVAFDIFFAVNYQNYNAIYHFFFYFIE